MRTVLQKNSFGAFRLCLFFFLLILIFIHFLSHTQTHVYIMKSVYNIHSTSFHLE